MAFMVAFTAFMAFMTRIAFIIVFAIARPVARPVAHRVRFERSQNDHSKFVDINNYE